MYLSWLYDIGLYIGAWTYYVYICTSTHGTPTVVLQPHQLRSFVRIISKENRCPAFSPAHQSPCIQVWIYIPVAKSIEPKPCILENDVPSCSFIAILALDSVPTIVNLVPREPLSQHLRREHLTFCTSATAPASSKALETRWFSLPHVGYVIVTKGGYHET